MIASKSKAENELEEFESVFFGLSHEARIRVLVVLMARGGRMTAGEIVERFKCSWPTMTRQMQTLEKVKAKSISIYFWIIQKKWLQSNVELKFFFVPETENLIPTLARSFHDGLD